MSTKPTSTKQQMREHPFMQGLSTQFQDELIDCAQEAFILKDRLVFQDGERADQFLLIEEGSFSLEMYIPNKADQVIQTLNAGELLGWSWMVTPYRWTFDVRALEDSRAFSIDARCISGKCHVDHEFGYQLYTRINQVMAGRIKALQLQLIDVYSHEPAK